MMMSNFGTVNFAGLEPIVNSGSASDLVFNMPPGANVATLGDDGTTENGLSRLSGSAFELTETLQAWAGEAPRLLELESLGRSYEGREIWLATVTNLDTGPASENMTAFGWSCRTRRKKRGQS